MMAPLELLLLRLRPAVFSSTSPINVTYDEEGQLSDEGKGGLRART